MIRVGPEFRFRFRKPEIPAIFSIPVPVPVPVFHKFKFRFRFRFRPKNGPETGIFIISVINACEGSVVVQVYLNSRGTLNGSNWKLVSMGSASDQSGIEGTSNEMVFYIGSSAIARNGSQWISQGLNHLPLPYFSSSSSQILLFSHSFEL